MFLDVCLTWMGLVQSRLGLAVSHVRDMLGSTLYLVNGVEDAGDRS